VTAEALPSIPSLMRILDEVYEVRAVEVGDLGEAELPLTSWCTVLSEDLGAVSRSTLAAEQSGALDDVRARALRLVVDSVALVEQLDRSTGRHGDLDDVSPERTPTPEPIVRAAPELEEPEPPPLPISDVAGDESWWNGDRWRDLLRRNGVRVADAIRQGQAIARTLGQPEPATLDVVSPAIAAQLRAWVESRSAGVA
jgi:hypothetical protein